MENTSEINEIQSDLLVRVKVKKCPRFKAGPELGKVQKIDVEVNEEETEQCSSIEINIRAEAHMTKADAKKALD